jgi:hypothetical protein
MIFGVVVNHHAEAMLWRAEVMLWRAEVMLLQTVKLFGK